MANHEFTYSGDSMMGSQDVDLGDTVQVKNSSTVEITVFWPACFEVIPTAGEPVAPNGASASRTIGGEGATLDQSYQVTVQPPETRRHDLELPETGVGSVYIKG